MIIRTTLFLLLNFAALALGSFLMGGNPADNEWYQNLNKAPWTPPGWVFGLAWSLIMVVFAVYMALLTGYHKGKNRNKLVLWYAIHWILNVSWNPIFFQFRLVNVALLILVLLFSVLVLINMSFGQKRFVQNLLIAPYLLWLILAFSLNLYVLF